MTFSETQEVYRSSNYNSHATVIDGEPPVKQFIICIVFKSRDCRMIGCCLRDEISFLIIPLSNLLDDMDLEETYDTGYEKE